MKHKDEPDTVENDYESLIKDNADTPVAICIECWRNANPEERKHLWGVFDETGLFLAACRHGIIVSICDMVKSGELYVVLLL